MNKNKIIMISAIVVGSLFLLSIIFCCGMRFISNDINPKIKNVYNKTYLNKKEIIKMYTNPESFKNRYVKLLGKVFNDIEIADNELYFQIWGDPKNNKYNTMLKYKDTNFNIQEDDYVEIKGEVIGAYSGENAFGGEVNAPYIKVLEIKKSNYKDVVSPTLKEIKLGKTINQNKCIITLRKIEFSKKETRIYVLVQNNSKDKFNLYDFNTKIAQENNQFEPKDNYDTGYKILQTELLPGIKSEGVIVFKPIKMKNFNIIFEGSSDDYNIDFKPYDFNIKIK